MSAAQLRACGVAAVREPACMALLMWKWDEKYFSQPDVRKAMEAITIAAHERVAIP